MPDVRIGDMVVHRRTGSIGLLCGMNLTTNRCTVQYGASGPYAIWTVANARRATKQEIDGAGLKGVGCNQGDET